MFRTRPPAYALACAALWFIQLCANLLLVFTNLPSGASHYWLLFNLVTTILLGMLILLQLPRALQWRPRRSARPSHELRQERQRIAEQQQAEQAEAERRAADVEHRRTINASAVTAIMLAADVDPEQAQLLLKAIVLGKIPNVSISY